jgi:hypothetical protein
MEGYMSNPRFFLIAVVCFASVGCSAPAPEPFDADGVEQVVRGFLAALQSYQLDSARAYLAPDARWIEAGYPIPASDLVASLSDFQSLGFGIQFAVRDLSVRGEGDYGWATWAIDGTFTVSSLDGKDFFRTYLDAGWPSAVDSSGVEWRGFSLFIESAVLQRQDGVWRIVLGHTTELPPEE